jgi:Flp pilus assembly protein TadG
MHQNLRVRFIDKAAMLAARACPRRFIRRQDGAAAVEFGLVALPFFGLMFAIIETAMVLFAGQVLETAVADSARLIMTGQTQAKSYNQTTFKASVCATLNTLFDCANNLYIDVKTYNSFSGVAFTTPLDSNGNLVNNFNYQPGAASDIVVVRFMYPWPIYVSLFGTGLANMANSQRLLVATAAFRNEPF